MDDLRRFEIEVALLRKCEDLFGLPSREIVAQLLEELKRPLPDILPPAPAWRAFTWPVTGDVDLRHYWRETDRGHPYLGGLGV